MTALSLHSFTRLGRFRPLFQLACGVLLGAAHLPSPPGVKFHLVWVVESRSPHLIVKRCCRVPTAIRCARRQVMFNTWRIWGISGLGNLAGSLFVAGTVFALSILPPGGPAMAWIAALTVKKCSLPLMTMVGKAACANWLVNIAIFQASSAHTTAGKIASLWLPIMTFVALGGLVVHGGVGGEGPVGERVPCFNALLCSSVFKIFPRTVLTRIAFTGVCQSEWKNAAHSPL